jgi:hypothetical protein
MRYGLLNKYSHIAILYMRYLMAKSEASKQHNNSEFEDAVSILCEK